MRLSVPSPALLTLDFNQWDISGQDENRDLRYACITEFSLLSLCDYQEKGQATSSPWAKEEKSHVEQTWIQSAAYNSTQPSSA